MATAPREDQLALLEVAECDAQIARLQRENAQHPLRADVGELMNMIAAKARDLSRTTTELAEAEKALRAASAKTADLAETIGSKEEKLNSGIGMDSRELLTLQSEIDTQRETLDQETEAEFAALAKVEELTEQVATIKAGQEVLKGKLVTGRAELESAVEAIDAEISAVERRRNQLFEPLAETLKSQYERARSRGGMAVIAMYPNGQTSGGVEISPIEVAEIKNEAPDVIHLSDDYGCIVVPVDTYA